MKTYKYKNATVYVSGEINKERLKKLLFSLLKKRINTKR